MYLRCHSKLLSVIWVEFAGCSGNGVCARSPSPIREMRKKPEDEGCRVSTIASRVTFASSMRAGRAAGASGIQCAFPGGVLRPRSLFTTTQRYGRTGSGPVHVTRSPGLTDFAGHALRREHEAPRLSSHCSSTIAPSCLMASRSVFSSGVVKLAETESPVRVTFKSVTGCGRSSEGGRGAPGVPHPVSATKALSKRAETGRAKSRAYQFI